MIDSTVERSIPTKPCSHQNAAIIFSILNVTQNEMVVFLTDSAIALNLTAHCNLISKYRAKHCLGGDLVDPTLNPNYNG